MVDIASIVVAVISLIASVAVAGFSAYLNYSTDKRKARREAEHLLQKYRDPLLFAAEDLQSRIWGIFEADVLDFAGRSPQHDDSLYIYTAFVLGQFFAWTHILRRQAQLLPFSLEEDKRLREFIEVLHSIQGVMLISRYVKEEGTAFTLWRGHQMAIGELMTEVGDNSEKMCMGFYDFTKAWKASPGDAQYDPHYWFKPIVEGLKTLTEKGTTTPTGNRLRRLQHLLIDLIEVLDPQKQRLHSKGISRCGAAPHCPCSKCPGEVGVRDTTGARTSPHSLWSRRTSETV
ncbi:hypothetical protein JX265_011184 [Neoarthrinium moseri]|uniref:Uncharacterized protein n=1 Tax=Neoarthrinium moseri TaxID=1658444 RepID=A0A9P9WCS7_9PEZI|nr:uncharacterized protein JN550_010488 [Neoarthrinium moseri]KAI1845920.1 hypothetical protein JX266_008007 [Neoarthrinium moseri]KAI1857449.1 hypothetical protein JX265_011184 [Neoarthrinium moseri]KAI1862023.1 hypothetical protein JN550_010488 [Neoarthrinium moseri]